MVYYQSLAFTYKVYGNKLKIIQHGGGIQCDDPQDFMDNMFKRNPWKLQIPEYPWDEQGKFKKVTIDVA